jgi:hypothetical protein
MSSSSDTAREIDRVLRPLGGHGLYRNNAFRVTGLSTDASARQIRRHQEELKNPYHLAPATDRDLPLPPSDDADAQRAAFEVLRDPLARLVHELFWLRPDQPSRHEHAIFAHSRALEAISRDGEVVDDETWDDLQVGLRLLAQGFADDSTWEWVRRRAEQIDDPRLSVGVLRALRERLPEHVIGVSVGLAVRAAGADPAEAEAHLAALREAGFEARQVREVARAAVEGSGPGARRRTGRIRPTASRWPGRCSTGRRTTCRPSTRCWALTTTWPPPAGTRWRTPPTTV